MHNINDLCVITREICRYFDHFNLTIYDTNTTEIKMDPLEEFAAFHGKTHSASTRRVYLDAAKTAVKILGVTHDNCGSYEELFDLAHHKIPRALRIAPFMDFLESKTTGISVERPDYEPVRTWMIDRIGKETKAVTEASLYVRRDFAMLAGLCVAPEKGSPQRWPKSILMVTRQKGGFQVKLWEKEVAEQALALALLYWHRWRERLARTDQSRFYHKALAYSDLLFPDSKGGPLTKHALRNALLRLTVGGERPAGLTPGIIREAFMQLEG
jgi:hypothetical protein